MTKAEAEAKVAEVYGEEFVERFRAVAKQLREATTPAERSIAVSTATALYFEAEANRDGMDALKFLLPTLKASEN